ncbi:TrlF family AAA-like ATPase [Pseudomonas grimontii]|uniref:TrlF family AAA-like ATPase n=1 Tax=Pseudomonas grimontii TaxID=129847 RepID=UPI00387B882B
MYPRGSEWRKWDLHVHTPSSVLRSEFGQDWDRYVVALFTRAIAEGVSVIGITDYYIPEGYRILKKDYLDKPQKLELLFDPASVAAIRRIKVFPNVEFRISKLVIGKEPDLSWNRKVNYHVVLSDMLSPEKIDSDFISQIKICFDASAGVQAEMRPLTKSNLEALGRRLIQEHPPFANAGGELFVGMMNASVDENQLISILSNNATFKDKYLIGLPCDEDLSDVNWNSQGHNVRKNLIKQSHFIFSSNPKTARFFLGGNDKESFAKEFGAVKACLWGSDAHTEAEMFRPAKNRHTWIKSDLTFEGLKQVVYDPSSRVVIQELCPQQKSSYQTIDQVRFVDKSSSRLFSPDWQVLNPDLNTIIGGKSSGKSLLLYHIARAVNAEEVDQKIKLSKSSGYTDLNAVDFEVLWSNGDVSKLSDFTDKKPITYIPQLYINHLAEEDGKAQLNGLVKNILLQNNKFKQFSELQEKSISLVNKEVVVKIDLLFELRQKYHLLVRQAEDFGVLAAIQSEADRLRLSIAALREKSGFTAIEETLFKRLVTRKSSLERRESTILKIDSASQQAVISSRGGYASAIESLKDRIVSDVDLPVESLYMNKLLCLLDFYLSSAVENFNLRVLKGVESVEATKQKLAVEFLAVEQSLQPLLIKITDQEALELMVKQLKAEELKLKGLEEIFEKQESIKKIGLECKQELSVLYESLIFAYKEYAEEIAKPDYQFEAGLDVSAEVAFDEDKFNEFVLLFDRRGNLNALVGDLLLPSGEFDFDAGMHPSRVKGIHERFTKKVGIPTVRKGVDDIDILKKLYCDCFDINYIVRYRNDDIATMSPGKRGLVLLNLILHLSNSSHPILIDQPEDNLDNRTIYDQLKDFVRQKKSSRQIIMVTHNANLVVAADAECVIVANQAGQQADSDPSRYRFEYFSGGLECTYDQLEGSTSLNGQGIRQHVCEVLEGGVSAFKEREMKYGLKA